jgi:hypothetical protein
MLIFPNPTGGNFTVELDTDLAGSGTLEIYNLQGAKVYSARQSCAWAHIDLSYLAEGVYIVLLRTSERAVNQKRLLVLVH